MVYTIRNIYRNAPGIQLFLLADKDDFHEAGLDFYRLKLKLRTYYVKRGKLDVFFSGSYTRIGNELRIIPNLNIRKHTKANIISVEEIVEENKMYGQYTKEQTRELWINLDKKPEEDMLIYIEFGNLYASEVLNIDKVY